MERALLRSRSANEKALHSSKICGPSGDIEMDTLIDNCLLPNLSPGRDWIMINFGSVMPTCLNTCESDIVFLDR